MTTDAYHMPDQFQLFCPSCNLDLTLAKHERGDVRKPKAGDHTVCSHCFSYLQYAEPEPGQLRLDWLTDKGFEGLQEQSQIGLIEVRAELKAQKASGPPTRYEAALFLELTALKCRVVSLESARCGCVFCRNGDGLNCLYRRSV